MRRAWIFIVIWGFQVSTLRAQDSIVVSSMDSASVMKTMDFLYQQLFDEADGITDEDVDEEELSENYEELLEEYERLQDHPININGKQLDHLWELGLLSGFQIDAVRDYQKQFGDFLFAEELIMVEGFDKRTVAVLSPIICFEKNDIAQEMEKVTMRKAVTRGRHVVTLNYAQKFTSAATEEPPNDSLIMAHPNAYPLGNSMKLQVKYSYHYGKKIRAGFVMEKDAGEPLTFGGLSETVQELARSYRRPGFDFYGGYVYLTEIGKELCIRDFVAGDYQLSFGQGLTLWNGMSFGKVGAESSVMKRAAGVRPKASASEGKFFRGAAMTVCFHGLQATAFYSHRHIDATVIASDTLDGIEDEALMVSAIQESGYHRTLGELAKRHNLQQQVFGGHLSYSNSQVEVGYTLYHTRLGSVLRLNPSKYNQFFFQGDRLTNMGLDIRCQWNKVALFGELSYSSSHSFAGIMGATFKPKGYIDFTLCYRNYGLHYQNLFFGGLKESSRGQAEESFYLGLRCAPVPHWELLAHCDFFRFKWLTSQVYAPSYGQEYQFKLMHQVSRDVTMQLKFKSKTRMKNSTDPYIFSYYPIFYTKRSIQFQVSYTLFGSLLMSHKLAYTHYLTGDGIDSRGYSICQDIAYKPDGKPYSLTFRYALFDSDDYNSRISIYENDVLGAFSIPSLYGWGSRVYLLGKLKLFDAVSIYSKIGFSFLTEESKADVKAEVVWKF